MSRAAAAARRRHAPATRPVAPRGPRRVSGPSAGRGAVALPPPRRSVVGAILDHGLLDALLRSRAWIWVIGIALGGIVAMQVSMLKLNTGISRAVESAATLERQNAELEVQVARLSSDDRIRLAAEKLGLVMPDAGAVKFLHSRGDRDAGRAARRMTPPSPEARALMAAGGRAPAGGLPAGAVAAPVTQAAPVATPTPAPAATAAPTPAPIASPAPTPAAVTATGGQTAPGQG